MSITMWTSLGVYTNPMIRLCLHILQQEHPQFSNIAWQWSMSLILATEAELTTTATFHTQLPHRVCLEHVLTSRTPADLLAELYESFTDSHLTTLEVFPQVPKWYSLSTLISQTSHNWNE